MLSIISYLREGLYFEAIIVILSRCFIVFCCLPIHELAHGYIAYKLGDDTARLQGRLTFNPFSHLNPLGTLMIFLFGIGYANPVPIDFSRLKNPRKDTAIIALAGPVSNLLMGFVSVFVYYALSVFDNGGTVMYAIRYFFYFAASVNVTLAVFNILPIPPLDGSKILASVLPDRVYFKYMRYEQYVMIALMLLLFSGVLSGVISWLSNSMMTVISIIPSLIFRGA